MTGDAAHHLGRVLRAEAGQLYELSDGKAAWLARIERAGRDEVTFQLVEPIASRAAAFQATLLLSIVKFDSFEWALEKATELGVHTVVPLAAARSEKALLQAAEKRSERWKKILLEASQQSRRMSIPVLAGVEKPGAAFARASDVKIMLSERVGARHMREILPACEASQVTLAIGPEGGWTEEELELFQKSGWQFVSLGSTILRSETAVIAALALTIS